MTMQRMQHPVVKAENIDTSYVQNYHMQQQQLLLQQQQQQQQQRQQQQRQQQQQQQQKLSQKTTVGQTHEELPENVESLPDFPSIKGVFGWTTIDNVNIPYILRQDKQFVSVRIVEMKLLSRYPNSYPDDLGKHAPLTSFFITVNEAKLLNEINLKHCDGDYGKKEFSTKDLIVLLSDFILFYTLVKKTFPDGNSTPYVEANTAGWLQIRNTVSPYITRRDGKYLPLSVVQHAAGLLTNVKINGALPSKRECELLNEACKAAGVEFAFSESTKLIKVDDILRVTPVEVIELPSTNPLKHATYMELPTSNSETQKSQPRQALPPQQSQRPPQPASQQMRYPSNPTQMEDIIKSQLHGRAGSQDHMNGPGGAHPPAYPGMPMFDPRFANMYRLPNFPRQNRYPNSMLPNYGQPPIPPGLPIPPNVSVNSLAHYYMTLQQNAAKSASMGGHASKGATNAPPLQSALNNTDFPSRSPGASPSIPSPRSRPPSQSHSGSRPPSNAPPLSPAAHRNAGLSSPTFPPTPDMSPGIQHSPFFGGTSQQVKSMHPQQQQFVNGPTQNDRHGHHGKRNNQVPPSHSKSQGMQPPSPTIGTNFHSQAAAGVPGMINPSVQGHNQSANQELPGLFTPTTSNVTVPQKSKPTTQASDIGSPPPLLMVSRPVSKHTTVSQPGSNSIQTEVPSTIDNRVPDQVVLPPPPVQSTPVIPVTSPALVNQAPNKPPPPPQPVSMAKPTNQSSYSDAIKGAWLNNKIISCLQLDKPDRNGKFCLVEAVCKLYFHGCSVNEFLFALENVLSVPLVTCDDSEEKAFIQYYSLPVDVLKCNKMIKFDDLEKFFPQLSYMFPAKGAGESPVPQDSSETDSGYGEQENNQEKGLVNGLMSAKDLEAAMPGTVSEMTAKRTANDATIEPVPKHARLTGGSGEFDDAVIILD